MYKKVTLISLPKQDLIRPPGALPILAAACEDHNIDYEIRDFNLWLYNNTDKSVWSCIDDNWDNPDPFDFKDREYYKIFLEKLKTFIDLVILDNSDLIAISIFADNSGACALEFIKELNLRKTRTKFDIAIGGTGIRARLPRLNDEELCCSLLSQKLIDFYLFGEGEEIFRKLLIKETEHPGINNFQLKQIENLDDFSFPSYKKINPSNYPYEFNPEIIITGSKGCVRACTYCDVAKYWPKFRYRSGAKIAEELYSYYKNIGIKNFEFSDSLINGSIKQFREMNKSLLEYKKCDDNFNISYKGQFICRGKNQFKEQDYIDMKSAGCDYIYVGVESFSDPVRYAMDKKFTNEDLDFHLEMCGKHNIKNSFLMLVGYPTETLDDHKKNLEALKKYQHYAQAGVIAMIVFGYTASILEETPLYNLQHQMRIVNEFPKNLIGNSNWISLNNPSLTLKERIRRWVELTEVAIKLGYAMPRNIHYLNRFINLLEKTNHKNH
jgi:hypothetical protein